MNVDNDTGFKILYWTVYVTVVLWATWELFRDTFKPEE